VPNYTNIRRGRRPDLGDVHFRSSWEANYARFLNWRVAQGQIVRWEFEPQSFVFSGVSRGCVFYLPDFRITNPDGSQEYIEVKGRETSKDRTKWKRMRSHYPNVRLTIVDAPAYRRLCQDYGNLPNWER
jgi:hypothetical protein